MTLAELNACDRARFVEEIGWVFEHSPWIAERAWARRPFASVDDLQGALEQELASASIDEQLNLLCAHPDLGARMQMSGASSAEQSAAGLDRMSRDDEERLRQLNAQYKQKFGIPFLLAVKGSTLHQILGALEERLPSTFEAELTEAMRQASRIARFRLEEAISIE